MLTSFSDTSNSEMTSASMTSNSFSVSEVITTDVISNVAITPVLEGVPLGILDVGAMIGCIVGFAVTKTAQTSKLITYFRINSTHDSILT